MIAINYIGKNTKRPNIQSIYLDGREREHPILLQVVAFCSMTNRIMAFNVVHDLHSILRYINKYYSRLQLPIKTPM